MEDLSQAVPAAHTITIQWIFSHSISIEIPGLGTAMNQQSRVDLRRLNSAIWLLGPDAQKHMQLLFEKGDGLATFVGFGTAGNAEITRALGSLGIDPAAIMPNGQRRYNVDAISELQRQSEKLDAPGQGV